VAVGEARVVIAVFLRPATPGRVKTRLIPRLGVETATALYRAFAGDVIEHASGVQGASTTLWVAGRVDDPDLAPAAPELPRRAQPEADLGTRMRVALLAGLDGAGQSLVVGSDVPSLPARLLADAFCALERHDIALTPSADGGYMVIAARRTHPAMFSGVRMSTRHALADTVLACEQAGLSVGLTAPWFDVDTPTDLDILRAQLALAPGMAPRTAGVLRAHGMLGGF
jgi:rSAM/selenodomain-associated transferase 1